MLHMHTLTIISVIMNAKTEDVSILSHVSALCVMILRVLFVGILKLFHFRQDFVIDIFRFNRLCSECKNHFVWKFNLKKPKEYFCLKQISALENIMAQ